MKKFVLFALTMASLQTLANTATDLTLSGERWLAKFTAFVCEDGNTQTSTIPSEFAKRKIMFTRATTDYSLDNYLFKATFEENGNVCNYSALMLADNAAWTIKLVQSVAHSNGDESLCSDGANYLNNVLSFNNYKYLHGRAAIYLPTEEAGQLCSPEQTNIGLHFQVMGKIQ